MFRTIRLCNKNLLNKIPKYNYSTDKSKPNINSTFLILEPIRPLDDTRAVRRLIPYSQYIKQNEILRNPILTKYILDTFSSCTKPIYSNFKINNIKNTFHKLPGYISDIVLGVVIGAGIGVIFSVMVIL